MQKIKNTPARNFVIISAYLPKIEKIEAQAINFELIKKFANNPIFTDLLMEDNEIPRTRMEKVTRTYN